MVRDRSPLREGHLGDQGKSKSHTIQMWLCNMTKGSVGS